MPIRFVDLEGSELVLRSEVEVLRRVANELFKSRQAGLNRVLGDEDSNTNPNTDPASPVGYAEARIRNTKQIRITKI